VQAIQPSNPPVLCARLQGALAKLLIFNRLDAQLQRKIVQEMYERKVGAGEILMKEGDTGLAATELFVVKSGKFEVRSAQGAGVMAIWRGVGKPASLPIAPVFKLPIVLSQFLPSLCLFP